MSSPPRAQILLLCGSLRRDSLNARLLDVMASMAPAHLACVQAPSLAELPLYNEDLDTASPPAAVQAFRAALVACDGMVIASPEYNHGLSAPLKNAIDWGSRPYAAPNIGGKCVSVVCATPGEGLGFQGLAQAVNLLHALGNFVVVNPRVVLQRAGSKLVRGEDGRWSLNDSVARMLLAAQLGALDEALAAGAGKLSLRGNELYAQSRAQKA